MITTTLGSLVTAEAALGRLKAMPLPIKTAYAVAKLSRLVYEHLKPYHDQRIVWVRELGEPIDNGVSLAVKPEHWDEFKRRCEELQSVDVTIDWTPVPLASMGDVQISAEDLLALGPLVVLELPQE